MTLKVMNSRSVQRHLDVKWLWIQKAMQAGRFTKKTVGSTENISDLSTKYHDEERLKALLLGGLQFTIAQRPEWMRSQGHNEQGRFAQRSNMLTSDEKIDTGNVRSVNWSTGTCGEQRVGLQDPPHPQRRHARKIRKNSTTNVGKKPELCETCQ